MIKHCFIFIAFLSLSCATNDDGPPGKIKIRNDILDKEYNSFTVDRVISKSGLSGYRKTLKPGEQTIVPFAGIKSLRFRRRYKNFSRVYVVKCPDISGKKVTLKLIDIHVNRMQGGCTLSKKGTQHRGGMIDWE